ncbi:MAG: leucine--tRNA ligase [Nanoarchaeota archaeon]|nr:leucine--tRNA ligase [Nanoarchaeota archaeon]
MSDIDFGKIEKKWQKKWEEAKIFEARDIAKFERCYVLEMFPYPSGKGLHIGHAWNFLIGDILARYKRLKGFNVLHPMGYDSLGLPAENAAIKDGIHPKNYTAESIKNFINQQKTLGFSYDWSRMISSADSSYYRWDQWIFLKMFEKGLAYQKESNVNWCPSCETVLANEQAQTGNCDRCGSKVETKFLKQWFLKITDYADELYEGIDNLKDWPERTKAMQKNWIGKSHGTEIKFEINGKYWNIFTTRPDTLFGVTFMVISAQHKKLWDLVTDSQKKDVEKFLKKLKSVSEKDLADMEKEGVFTGSYAINPINEEKIPIYAGNFVVADYAGGMVMAVPAHDQRDFEFAKKYNIEIKQVIGCPKDHDWKRAYTDWGNLVNSPGFNGLKNEEAKKKITDWLIKNKLGKRVTQFRLRDWGISRQRYWGTPIPIIHCGKCGIVPVKEKDLPVELPDKVKFGEGNPLETNESWIKTKCPKCKGEGRRETDTMDTFVNSSWYFMRYCDPQNSKEIFNKNNVKDWCPVDYYVGGSEHACMHLIYSRFYTKFLADMKLINFREPFNKLFHQGFIYGEDGEKMSKSLGNTVDPLDTSKEYGVDTLRFFLVSVASPDKDFNWSEKGISGSSRFLNRVFNDFSNLKFGKDSEKLEVKLNNTIKNVSNYYETFEYRKATIELRELFDMIFEEKEISKETFGKALKLLNPICPHITEELWSKLGEKEFLSINEWPDFDSKKLKIKKKEVDLNAKIFDLINPHVSKGDYKMVYIYTVPFELDKINPKFLEDKLGLKAKVFSVADPNKIDLQNKSKRARPGMPGFYLE